MVLLTEVTHSQRRRFTWILPPNALVNKPEKLLRSMEHQLTTPKPEFEARFVKAKNTTETKPDLEQERRAYRLLDRMADVSSV